jgi:hypothetical protein
MSSDTDLRELSSICEEIAREGRTTLSGRDYMTTARGKQIATTLQQLAAAVYKLDGTLNWSDMQRLTDAMLAKEAKPAPVTRPSVASEPSSRPILCLKCGRSAECGWNKLTECDDFSEWVES